MKNAGDSAVVSHKVALVLAAVLIIVVAGLLFFLSGSSKADSLTTALPQDAIVVARVDAKKLVNGDNLLADAIDMYTSKDDLEDTGLDFRIPAYVFAFQKYGGCVVALREEDDFMEFATQDGKIERQRGLKWGSAFGNFLVASDGQRAMIIGPATADEQAQLRNQVCKWLKEQDKCLVNADVMEAVNKGEGFLTVAGSSDNLPPMIKQEINKTGVDVKGMCFVADLSLTRKELALEIGVVGMSDSLLAASKGGSKILSGSLAGTCGERPFAHAEVGVNGKEFLQVLEKGLKEIPEYQEMWSGINAEMGLDMIVKSINGDVSITIPEFPRTSNSAMLLQADLEDDAFMKNVSDWNNSGWLRPRNMEIKLYRDNIYKVCEAPIYFGTKQNRLLIATQEQMLDETPGGKSALPREAEGALAYACVNLEKTDVWKKLWEEFPLLNLVPEKLTTFKEFNRLLFVAKDNARVRISLGTWD